MNDIQQSILESLSLVADASIKKSQSTLTIETEILEVIDSGIGSYKVEYMGNKFIAYTNNQSVQYSVGSKVYVLIPNGDFSKEKVIIGALVPNGSMYSATAETITKYLEKSDNLLNVNYNNDDKTIKLCTYHTELNRPIELSLGNFSSVFKGYLEQYNTLSFSCNIKTDIPITQRAGGNYGIALRLYYHTNQLDDNGKEIIMPKDYIIDTTNIIGDPYGLSVWTTQKFYVTIDTETYDFNSQPELYVFVKDFTQSEEEKPYDIFISKVSLKVVDTLSDSDLSGYYLSIKAQQGEIFLKNDTTSYTTLVPELKINGHNTSVNGYDCYWFVEDVEINEISNGYHRHGGRGWRCLNEKINITKENDKETFQYKTNNYEYIVQKANVLTALRYKCVVIYNNQILSSIIKIKNLDSNIEFNLKTSTGSNVYVKDTGSVYLITRLYYDGITNTDNPAGDIIYNWARYSKDDVFLNEDFYTVDYEDKVIEEDGKLWYETQIHFPVSYIEELNTITCTAKEIRSTGSNIQKVLIGTESINISTSADFEFLLNIQNGDVLYKYDADGDSPMIANYDGPESSVIKEVKPLSFTLFKRDGTELTETEYAFCKVKWTISKNSMLKLKTYTSEDENNYYIEGNGIETIVNYDILPQYNSSKTDNTVILQIEFDNKKLHAAAAIKFLKDGANGTNGTKYAAVITHNGYGYREKDAYGNHRKLQLVYIKKEGWKYFDIEHKILSPLDTPIFHINVYRDGQLIRNYQNAIEWSMFDRKETEPCFSIDNNGQLSIIEELDWEDSSKVFCNIIQAKITVIHSDAILNSSAKTGDFIYAYYPIEITYLDSIDLAEGIIPTLEGGFSSVLYAADGTNPKYDTTFDFICHDSLYNNDEGNIYDYNWSTSDNLHFVETTSNISKITPVEKYDNGNSKNYVKVALTLAEEKKTALTEELNILTEEKNELNTQLNINKNIEELLNNFINNYKDNELKYMSMTNWLADSEAYLVTRSNMLNILTYLEEQLKVFLDFCKENDNFLIRASYSYTTIINNCQTEINNIRKKMFTYGTSSVTIDAEGKETQVDLKNLVEMTKNLTPSNAVIENIQSLFKPSIYQQLFFFMDDYQYNSDLYNQYLTEYLEIENNSEKEFSPLTRFSRFRYSFYKLSQDSYLNQLLDHQEFVNFKNILLGYYSLMGSEDGIVIPQYLTKDALSVMLKDFYSILFKYFEYKQIEEEYQLTIASSYLNSLTLNELTTQLDNIEIKITQINQAFTINNINSIVHIRPIIMTYNRYEMSSINGWDGNKLYTGSNNEGDYLYAPQMGAGKKNDDGSFTGMVMGLRKKNNNFQVGLFGYAKGLETMFLNAEDGSASFGTAGAGQIIISPGNGTKTSATIYGGNWSEEEGTGLLIDLTAPAIKFGSGNFSVSPEGYLTAKGGGSIAGWRIGESILTAFSEQEGNVLTLDSLNKTFYAYAHDTLENTDEGFYLGPDGLSIGSSIRILDSQVYIGTLTHGHKHWTISALGTNSYISYNTDAIAQTGENAVLKDNSVYLGTDGISLGKFFKVDNTGMLEVGKLNGKHWRIAANDRGESYIFYGPNEVPVISHYNDSVYLGTDGISLGTKFRVVKDGTATFGNVNGTKNWTVTTKAGQDDPDAYIAYNTADFNTDSNSVYLGTDGISLGKEKFYVTNKGVLTAKEGHIAGWNFDGNHLESSSGYMKINGNGSMSGGKVAEGEGDTESGTWSITQSGKATFNRLEANTSGTIAGWRITSNGFSGGSMSLNKDGSMSGSKWDISADGVATFKDINVLGGRMNWGTSGFKVDNSGVIDAPSGKLGPWTLNETGIYDDGTNPNVFIKPNGEMRMVTGLGNILTNNGIEITSTLVNISSQRSIGIRAVETLNLKSGNDIFIEIGSNRENGNIYMEGTVAIADGLYVSADIKTTGSIIIGTTSLNESTLINLINKMHDKPAKSGT